MPLSIDRMAGKETTDPAIIILLNNRCLLR
jgi:hypothetical protein